ncbi:MAG: hypothetical protein HOC77_07795 [Chloroflexi bacterium]|nr:hypothetical protein [Chloroflexota bacterium]MBT4514977.1 hypothetical protein [Chloroflexota bacterium]
MNETATWSQEALAPAEIDTPNLRPLERWELEAIAIAATDQRLSDERNLLFKVLSTETLRGKGDYLVDVGYTAALSSRDGTGVYRVCLSAEGRVLDGQIVSRLRWSNRFNRKLLSSITGLIAIAIAVLAIFVAMSDDRSDGVVQVAAVSGWVNSGITVESGVRYASHATGRVEYIAGSTSTPDGVSSQFGVSPIGRVVFSGAPWLAPDLPAYSLIAKVGDAGRPFFLGSNSVFEANERAPLYLALNDVSDSLHDNDLDWDVQISTVGSDVDVSRSNNPRPTVIRNGDQYSIEIRSDAAPGSLFSVYEWPGLQILGRVTTGGSPLIISRRAESESRCVFVRETLIGGPGLASDVACFTAADADSELILTDVLNLGPDSAPGPLAISETRNRIYIADKNKLHVIDATSLEPVETLAIPGFLRHQAAEMLMSRDERAMLISGFEGKLSIVTMIDPDDLSIIAVHASDDLEFGGGGIIQSAGLNDSIYVVGLHGWLEINSSGELLNTVEFDGMRGAQPAISDDGAVIYGQKADTVTEDTAYAMDAKTGGVLASFTFGDAGGATYAGTTKDGPSPILFIGSGAREFEQRALVLDSDTLEPVQTINGTALDKAVGAGSDRILIFRSAVESTNSPGTGLTVVRYAYNSQGSWELDETLELISGPGIYSGEMVGNTARSTFYLTSPNAGRLFVVTSR